MAKPSEILKKTKTNSKEDKADKKSDKKATGRSSMLDFIAKYKKADSKE